MADRRRGILHPLGSRLAERRIDFQGRDLSAQPARGELAIVFLAPPRPAERLDHELYAITLTMVVVAEALEDAQDRLRDAEDLRCGQELVQQPRRSRHDRGAATGSDPEAAPAVGRGHG